MTEFLRLARSLRRDLSHPGPDFAHRLRVGLVIAALILLLSLIG